MPNDTAASVRRREMDKWLAALDPSLKAAFDAAYDESEAARIAMPADQQAVMDATEEGLLQSAKAAALAKGVGESAAPPAASAAPADAGQGSAQLASKPGSGADKQRDDEQQEMEEEKEALADPKKRLEALAKWKVEAYSDKFKNDTKTSRVLDDLETGTKKAEEYIKYIAGAADYMAKHGKQLEGVSEAAAGLKKIADKVKDGLDKAGGYIERAEQINDWITAAGRCADASARLNFKDRDSVKAWGKSMQDVLQTTEPFIDWLKDNATKTALTAELAGESAAAGALSATLSVVGAQLTLGIKALRTGLENEKAYLDKYDKIMKEIENQKSLQSPPPGPAVPEAWRSREEEEKDAKLREDRELIEKMRGARAAKEHAENEAVKQATAEFEHKIFLKIYQAHRMDIRAKIREALRQNNRKHAGTAASPESKEAKWWDCLVSSEHGEWSFDEQAGINVFPTKDKVSDDEARVEIAAFKEVSPPCPFVKELHDGELKKFIAQKTAAQ